MNMYGFGFPGQGFFSLKLPGISKQPKKDEHVGLIRVKKGEATVERIEKELRKLIDDKWLWKVKQVADNEYVAIFPNKQILEVLSRSNGVELALYNISTTLTPTEINTVVSSVLQEGWVQLFYVPDFARTIDAVTLIAEKGGEVLAVDELSLIKEGPVRVKLRGRDISKIRVFLEVFVEKYGFDIKFVPESNKPPLGDNPANPKPGPNEDSYNGDNEDGLDDSSEEFARKTKEIMGAGAPTPNLKVGHEIIRGSNMGQWT
jgi:ribosomal protein L18E